MDERQIEEKEAGEEEEEPEKKEKEEEEEEEVCWRWCRSRVKTNRSLVSDNFPSWSAEEENRLGLLRGIDADVRRKRRRKMKREEEEREGEEEEKDEKEQDKKKIVAQAV